MSAQIEAAKKKRAEVLAKYCIPSKKLIPYAGIIQQIYETNEVVKATDCVTSSQTGATILFMILKVSVPKYQANKNLKSTYGKVANAGTSYRRFYTCADLMDNNGSCFGLKEINHKAELALWDGTRKEGVSVGSILALKEPQWIDSDTFATVPVYTPASQSPIIPLQYPNLKDLKNDIFPPASEETTRFFMLHEAKVIFNLAEIRHTGCTGTFCDRPYCKDLTMPCGCFNNGGNVCGANHTFASRLEIRHPRISEPGATLKTDRFSSLRFLQFIFDGPIPGSAMVNDLTKILVREDLKRIQDYVNRNGRFDVVGYYKKGVKSDITVNDSKNADKLVISDRVIYHITRLEPHKVTRQELEQEGLLIGREYVFPGAVETGSIAEQTTTEKVIEQDKTNSDQDKNKTGPNNNHKRTKT